VCQLLADAPTLQLTFFKPLIAPVFEPQPEAARNRCKTRTRMSIMPISLAQASHSPYQHHSGWLYKEGSITGSLKASKKWFVLERDTLTYYDSAPKVGAEDSSKTKPKGCVYLTEFTEVAREVKEDSSSGDKRQRFHIITPQRTFVLFADTDKDCGVWLNAIVSNLSTVKIGNGEAKGAGAVGAVDEGAEGETKGVLWRLDRGFRKRWKQNYFCLVGAQLQYYKAKDGARQGVLDLGAGNCIIINTEEWRAANGEAQTVEARLWPFEVRKGDGTILTLAATDETVMQAWEAAINTTIEDSRDTSTVYTM
jgi:hypothetical protein